MAFDPCRHRKAAALLLEGKSQATKALIRQNDSTYTFAMDATAQFHAILIDDDPAYNYLNELLFEQMPAFHPPRFFENTGEYEPGVTLKLSQLWISSGEGYKDKN
jgi:hypothetical protein